MTATVVIALIAGLAAGAILSAPAWRRFGALGAAVAAIGAAAGGGLIYLASGGQPGTPGAPYAEAAAERAAVDPAELTPEQQFKRLEELAGERSDDPVAQVFYARELMRRGREVEAVEAYRRAARMAPDAAILTELGEAIVVLNEGEMTPEARAAFDRALDADPDAVFADFYLAAAAYEAEPGADTSLALAQVAARLDSDDRRSQAVAGAVADRLSRLRRGPAEGGAPPASVDDMVGRLADRVEAQPNDLGLWLALARVQAALGRREAALDSLAQAGERFADHEGAVRVIAAARARLPNGAKGGAP